MRFDFADMNNISASLFDGFDFVWSPCALEHLGSKQLGLEFIVKSAQCLKPGGMAVHATEFDLSGQSKIDNWQTVLYYAYDFTVNLAAMLEEINRDGSGRRFSLLPFDLRRGTALIDGYVDIPPYSYHQSLNESFRPGSGGGDSEVAHDYPCPQLDLSVDGFPRTSIAILVRRDS